jgi:hypothetical protein
MILRELINKWKHLNYRLMDRKTIFTDIYRGRKFGGDESFSGPGSALKQTDILREKLPPLLRELGVRTFLDAPCGDFNWMREIDLGGISYIGADIVEELIKNNNIEYSGENRRFIVADITKDALPQVDIILCRDCFVHLSNRDINRAVKNFKKSSSKYLLTTTFADLRKNPDMVTGRGWRAVNLVLPPFDFPLPFRLLREECTEENGKYSDKSLGLWCLANL